MMHLAELLLEGLELFVVVVVGGREGQRGEEDGEVELHRCGRSSD